jgi:solute carrier family 50 protein (sugar transporter)
MGLFLLMGPRKSSALYLLNCCCPVLPCNPSPPFQAQDMLRNIFLGGVFLFWLMGLISIAGSLNASATKTLWGATSVALLGVYYVAPLSSVAKVVAERDSSSLHWPLCMMNIINGMLWFAYGLALRDWFIALPVSRGERR